MTLPPNDARPVVGTPLRWTLRVLAWTGLVLSAYLTLESLGQVKIVGCAGGETVDCESVIASQWSTWLGLPVALGGLGCYLGLAILTALLGMRGPTARRWIGALLVMLSVVAAGSGLWFIGLQLFVIEKICTFCMRVHACSLTIAALVSWAMVIRPAIDGRGTSRRSVDRQVLMLQSGRSSTAGASEPAIAGFDGLLTGLAVAGATGGLALLIGGQVLFPPQSYSTLDTAATNLTETIEMDVAASPAAAAPIARDTRPDDAQPIAQRDEVATPTTTDEPTPSPVADTTPSPPVDAEHDLFAELERPTDRGASDGGEATAADTAEGDTADPVASEPAGPLTDSLAAAPEPAADAPADDLFAAEAGQPSADSPADQVAADEPAQTTSGAASSGVAADGDVPPQSVAGRTRTEPVVPVSTAGSTPEATTADWKSVTAEPEPAAPTQERPSRTVSLLNGKLKLDVSKHPLIGPLDAPNVIVELMSYDCSHCRRMHGMIKQGLKRYDGQLAVVEMVVPLEMGCNKYITSSRYSHPGSCTLTRLSLAVSMIDPDRFPEFHDFLLDSPVNPPSPEQALARAVQLVDRERLLEVMQSKEMETQINSYVELYNALESLSRRQGKPFGLPVQVLGKTVVSGNLANSGQLYWTWEKNLDLQPQGSASVGRARESR